MHLLLTLVLGTLAVSAQDYVECPPNNAKCTYKGVEYKFGAVGQPICWMKSSYGWVCTNPGYDGECPPGFIDIIDEPCVDPNPPPCPKPTTFDIPCTDPKGKPFTSGAPGDNACWKKKDNKWICGPKSGSKCKVDELEMSKCLPKVVCPKDPAFRTSCDGPNGQKFIYGDPGVNVCWGDGKNKNYVCGPKVNGKCPASQIDIATCPPVKPNPPTCPPSDSFTLKCTSSPPSDTTFFNYEKNPCWYKFDNSEWLCEPRVGDACRKDALDVKTCKRDKLPPKCPENPDYRLSCDAGDGKSSFYGNPSPNVCWTKNDKDAWQCGPKKDGKCTTSQLDISTCPPVKPDKPVCPPKDSYDLKCSNNPASGFYSPGETPCWYKNKGDEKWSCEPKDGGSCKNADTIDVNECEHDKPAPPCPYNPDYRLSCDAGDGKTSIFGNPGENACWTQNAEGSYQCGPKKDGKCSYSQLDITTCKPVNPDKPKCPPKDSYDLKCSNNPASGFYSPGETPCWYKNKGDEQWSCEAKDGDSCKNADTIDVTECEHDKPAPPCPYNPDYRLSCDAGNGKTSIFGNPGENVCWSQNAEGSYQCGPKKDGKCSYSQLDITTCTPVNPDKPVCPPKDSYDLKCSNNPASGFYSPGETPCWYKNKGDEKWSCEAKDGDSCKNADTIDVTECEHDKPAPPCPYNPDYRLSCDAGNGKTSIFGNPGENVCWSQNAEGSYQCGPKKDGKCSYSQLDITTCTPVNPDKPKCPPKDSYDLKCSNNPASGFYSPGETPCWYKNKGDEQWSCEAKDGDSCKNADTIDVTECEHDKPAPPCPYSPDYRLSCDAGDGKTSIFGNPGDNVCWSQSDEGDWKCEPKKNGKCAYSKLDITTCKPVNPDKPKCPPADSFDLKCSNNPASSFFEPAETPCWYHNGEDSAWSCEAKIGDNKCNGDAIDITKCDHAKKPPPCPYNPDYRLTCDAGYGKTSFYGNPGDNVCWTQSDEGDWLCGPKKDGKCTTSQLDITTCKPVNPDKPKCPPADSFDLKCSNNPASSFFEPADTPCWYHNKDNSAWNCEASIGDNKCNGDAIDITKCDHAKKPPPCPYNPDYRLTCDAGYGKTSFYGNPGDNVCWTQSDEGDWLCGPKKDGKCTTSQLDITTCKQVSPPKPKCPPKDSFDLKCSNNPASSFYQPGETPCWYIKSGEEQWSCEAREGDSCKNADTVDITTCEHEKPAPPCPYNPDFRLTCNAGNGKTSFYGNPGANVCWTQSNEGDWQCEPKKDGKCSYSQLDITTCKPVNPDKPNCPPKDSFDLKCSNNPISTFPDPGETPCWYKNGDEENWSCEAKLSDDKCNADAINVNECDHAKRPPPCPYFPSFRLTCNAGNGQTAIFGNPGVNVCWSVSDDKEWLCSAKKDGKCTTSQLDITTCPPPKPQPPVCPPPDSFNLKCTSSPPSASTFFDYGVNKCWYKDEDSADWKCEPATDGKCNPDSVDVSTCEHAKPPPPCPYFPTFRLSCETASGDIALYGNPGVNVCWSLGDEDKFVCTPKKDGKCTSSQLDISKCKDPNPKVPDCPAPDSFQLSCSSNPPSSSTFLKPGENVCWFHDGDDSTWFCEPKSASGCLKDSRDISECPKAQPPPLCPSPNDYLLHCDAGNSLAPVAGNPGEFSCWTYSADKWTCSKKVGGKCTTSQLDITSCNFNEPKEPECPPMDAVNLPCESFPASDSTFYNPGANVCWSKALNDPSIWLCEVKTNNGACQKGEKDVTTCPKLPPPPTCPYDITFLTKCTTKSGESAFAGNPGANKCWTHGNKEWVCGAAKADGKCGYSELDITTCKVPTPEPAPCPSVDQYELKCTSNPLSDSTFGNPGTNVCWNKVGDDWECQPKTDGDKCQKVELDITTCPPPIPIPECPADTMYLLTCDAGNGKQSIAGNPGVNECWTLNDDSWSCGPKQGGKCKYPALDIKTCIFKVPEKPICPPKDQGSLKCTSVPAGNSTFENFAPNNCWSHDLKDINKWNCRPFTNNGGCQNGEVDVSTCEHTPPCLPPDSRCSYYGGNYLITNPKAPGCWIKTKPKYGGPSYSCVPKKPGQSCKPGYIDIKPCYPDCPNAYASCTYNYKKYTPGEIKAEDKSAPRCWTATPEGQLKAYTCAPMVGKTCPERTVDVTNCFKSYDTVDEDDE